MSVYFITIFIVFLFSFFALENKNTVSAEIISKKGQTEKLCLFLVAITLIFVSGLRYYVGTDYGAYYKIFDNPVSTLESSIKELDEPGFPILAKIISWFTTDGAVFIFVTAAFTIGAILYVTYKNSDAYLFSSLLFIFTGVWYGSFNGIRQYFAAAIICLGHRLIFEKKFWKYLLCVFLAFLVHKSAIVMIIPYFILRNKITFRNIFLLTLGSIILLYNYEMIFSLLGGLNDNTIDMSNAYTFSQVNILRVIVNVIPAIFCLFLYSNSEKDEVTTFYLNILITYALLSIVGMNSPYLSRVNIYLGVLLPLSMGKLIIFKDKKFELIMKSIIVVLYFLFCFYEISISADLNTFKWIWQR